MNNNEVNIKCGIGNPAPDQNQIPDMTPLVLDGRYNTRLLLVRHGESLGNAVRLFLGHTDLDLSDRGHGQAKRTAEYLSSLHIDAIYSSDLLRAISTARPNAELHSLGITPYPGLREMFVGEWEGRYVSDIIDTYGTYFTEEWTENFYTFRGAPGGESCAELADRISRALLDIAKANLGKTVLVTFHAAAIRAFWGRLLLSLGQGIEDVGFPANASVSVLYFDGERFIPGEYSHAEHLRDL